jgi:hypothetical protein
MQTSVGNSADSALRSAPSWTGEWRAYTDFAGNGKRWLDTGSAHGLVAAPLR